MSLIIPEDYTEFLYWIKERTESIWNQNVNNWTYGAKWIGMTDDDIIKTEQKYNVKFTDNHKLFLKILHTIDKSDINTQHSENGEISNSEITLFYNWNKDFEEIENYINWPYKYILQDVLSDKIWLKSWGIKPKENIEKENLFNNWFNKAPNLTPINSHRFIISEPANSDNPILSIMGWDTIIYGATMRNYLLNELQDHLELTEYIEDNDGEWDYENINEFKVIRDCELKTLQTMEIPYWREFLISNGFNDYLEYNHKNSN